MNAIVLFSGGLDSSLLLYWAKLRYEKVLALTFLYGQNNEQQELGATKKLTELWRIEHKIIDLTSIKDCMKSDYTEGKNITLTENSSYVPNRSQLFFTLAHGMAQMNGYGVVLSSLWDIDYNKDRMLNTLVGKTLTQKLDYFEELQNSGLANVSVHEDSKEEFINSLSVTMELGSNIKGITIETPFMQKDKVFFYEEASKLGVLKEIIEFSNSCYNGEEIKHNWGNGCSRCIPCLGRKFSFEVFTYLSKLK